MDAGNMAQESDGLRSVPEGAVRKAHRARSTKGGGRRPGVDVIVNTFGVNETSTLIDLYCLASQSFRRRRGHFTRSEDNSGNVCYLDRRAHAICTNVKNAELICPPENIDLTGESVDRRGRPMEREAGAGRAVREKTTSGAGMRLTFGRRDMTVVFAGRGAAAVAASSETTTSTKRKLGTAAQQTSKMPLLIRIRNDCCALLRHIVWHNPRTPGFRTFRSVLFVGALKILDLFPGPASRRKCAAMCSAASSGRRKVVAEHAGHVTPGPVCRNAVPGRKPSRYRRYWCTHSWIGAESRTTAAMPCSWIWRTKGCCTSSTSRHA